MASEAAFLGFEPIPGPCEGGCDWFRTEKMASRRRIEVVVSFRRRPWEGKVGGWFLAAVMAVTDPGRRGSAEGFARFLVAKQPALWVFSCSFREVSMVKSAPFVSGGRRTPAST